MAATARSGAVLLHLFQEIRKTYYLRHSFASILVNGVLSIFEAGRQIKTTMRYAHLSEQTLAEAVNVVPLGEAV